VLGHRQADTLYVRFLKAIAPQEGGGDLTGDRHHGGGIHVGGGQAGDQVGRPRAGGGDADAHLAGGPRIAVGHVGRPLLVGDEDVMNGVLIFHQVVVGGQDGAAGQAEYNVYALFEKAFPDYLTASF
jgi:hypothetical protein